MHEAFKLQAIFNSKKYVPRTTAKAAGTRVDSLDELFHQFYSARAQKGVQIAI